MSNNPTAQQIANSRDDCADAIKMMEELVRNPEHPDKVARIGRIAEYLERATARLRQRKLEVQTLREENQELRNRLNKNTVGTVI